MSTTLFGIKSKYNIMSIFSIVDYDRLLKLIKNNKSLQKCLGIDKTNYKNRSDYQYVIRKKFERNFCGGCDGSYILSALIRNCIFLTATIIFFLFVLIYASVLASKGAFNENNTKDNYNKNYEKIIDKINVSLFGFLVYIFFTYIFVFCYAKNKQETESLIAKIINQVILVMIGLIYLAYEILIIFKLYLSYKIKKNKITWFMRCDYVLIIFTGLYLSAVIYVTIIYFCNVEVIKPKDDTFIGLRKFRDIETSNFELPKDFIKMKDYEKRKFILNNKNEYLVFSIMNENIISLINNFRIENQIEKLCFDETNDFKDLIFDKYSEPIIFNDENIFKLSNESFLLKYPINEFETRFNKREQNIINIILNDYLNKIIIIEKNNIQYIFLFHSVIKLDTLRNKEGQRSDFRRLMRKKEDRSYYYWLDKYYDC